MALLPYPSVVLLDYAFTAHARCRAVWADTIICVNSGLQDFSAQPVILLQAACNIVTEYLSRCYGVSVTILQAVCNPASVSRSSTSE